MKDLNDDFIKVVEKAEAEGKFEEDKKRKKEKLEELNRKLSETLLK